MTVESIATVAAFHLRRGTATAVALLLFAAPGAAAPAPLTTPSGIALRLLGDRPTVRPEPFGFAVEIGAELTNGAAHPVYVLTALAAERADLVVEMNNARQVCGHHFLWWSWDCFSYCNLPSEPHHLTPICEDDPEICCSSALRIAPGMAEPTPGVEATPPADVVYGIVASSDVEKVATALNLDPQTARLSAPPLQPGETWHLTLRVPVALGPRAAVPTFAVTLADDLGFASQVLPLAENGCAAPPADMVAWWPLDEANGATVVHDVAPPAASGTDNTGTPQPGGQLGGAQGPNAVEGQVEGALVFSGGGDLLQVADDPDLNFGKQDLSIDAWISPAQVGSSVILPVVQKLALPLPLPNPPTGAGYALYVESRRLHAAFGDGGLLATFVSDPGMLVPSAPAWTHVAVTLDHGAGAVTFYINGSAVAAAAPAPAMPAGSITNPAPLVMGASALPADGSGEIGIDELAIFRRALSAAEVRARYDAGARGTCSGCAGDCDDSGEVDIGKLITLVNIALGNTPASTCAAGDTDHDGAISIAELIAAVNSALDGCTAAAPRLTPSATPGT